MMYGCWFFRPEETFHLPTRKFLEREVFKSDQHLGCPLSQIVGKCAVMSVKDYFRLQPEGYAEQDVYVCESRYSSRCKTFKKIKVGCDGWKSHVFTRLAFAGILIEFIRC